LPTPRSLLLPAVAAAALLTGGCARTVYHQGYIIDADLVNSVQPRVDTRQSVAQVLGQPSFTSEFAGTDWYYVSRQARNYAYQRPRPVAQTMLRIHFDNNGVVQSIDRTGLEQTVAITPDKKVTPTLGRKNSFFHDLFGNIGTVGAGGVSPGGQGGGGRDTP
jgi:outer membrane protein assembly factor BamE (lipoprotein component of BamABCDE complex)